MPFSPFATDAHTLVLLPILYQSHRIAFLPVYGQDRTFLWSHFCSHNDYIDVAVYWAFLPF